MAKDIVRIVAAGIVVAAIAACGNLSDPASRLSAASHEVSTPWGAVPPLAEGKGRFVLTDWGGPPVPVWTYVPTQSEVARLPIVVVMHGTGRDADRYRNEWAAVAQLNRFIVLAPEFSKRRFPDTEGYNLGNVFKRDLTERNPEESWAFSALEPLFGSVVRFLGSVQDTYTLFGHSAGSQFVHRFLLYKPGARVDRYIAANAGWYTMLDFDTPYPYGLAEAGIDVEVLKTAFGRDVVVLLGNLDNDPAHPSLRRTPEAMMQGPHRYARGQAYFESAGKAAQALGVPFNWRLEVVEYAKHSNGEMAIAAAALIQ